MLYVFKAITTDLRLLIQDLGGLAFRKWWNWSMSDFCLSFMMCMYLLHSSQEMVSVVGVVWNSLLWDTSLYLHKNMCKIQSTPHLTLCKWWMDSTDAVTLIRTDWNLSKVRRPRWWAWNVRVWCPDKLWANNHCSSSNTCFALRHKLQNPLGERDRDRDREWSRSSSGSLGCKGAGWWAGTQAASTTHACSIPTHELSLANTEKTWEILEEYNLES